MESREESEAMVVCTVLGAEGIGGPVRELELMSSMVAKADGARGKQRWGDLGGLGAAGRVER